jgi:DNA-binding response OmpR family regulator
MTVRRNVLVVDDEPDVCWALATLLRTNHFFVVTAASGAEALSWLSNTRLSCDLILIDAKLTDIDGVDLAKQIRSETTCTAPMIMVSGYFYRDDGVVQDTLRSGLVSAFVTKPYRHTEMLATIATVLNKGQTPPYR